MAKKQTNLLLPTIPQTLLYLSGGILITIIANYETIISFIGGETLERVGGISYLLEGGNYYLDNIFKFHFIGTIAVLLFWAGVGGGIFCLFWLISNSAGEAIKFSQQSKFVRPKRYGSSKFWSSRIADLCLFLASLVSLLMMLSVLFTVLLPSTKSITLIILNNTSTLEVILAISTLLAGSFITFHAFYLLIHTFNYSRKLVFA